MTIIVNKYRLWLRYGAFLFTMTKGMLRYSWAPISGSDGTNVERKKYQIGDT